MTGRRADWRRIVAYGLLLAVGTLALQWLDYQRLARTRSGDIYAFLIAAGFLTLGVVLGVRVFARPSPEDLFDGNPKARAALGISSREMAVLEQLAAGHSNKEIARLLKVSPNTVKTHVAHLFEKLEAARRTDAINKARLLGILR